MMYWVGLLEEQTVTMDTPFESERLSLCSRFLRHLNLIPELREKSFEETLPGYPEEIRPASFT